MTIDSIIIKVVLLAITSCIAGRSLHSYIKEEFVKYLKERG